MNTLPYFQTADKNISLMQTAYRSAINPVLAVPLLAGVQLDNVALISGVTIIDTLLQRQMQGWLITDINAAATIFRSKPFNNLTLTLTSNAACVVSLWVY